MRILAISALFPPRHLGGYEILCEQVCRALSARGHAVTVLTSDHGIDRGPIGPEPGVVRVLRPYVPFDRPAARLPFARLAVSRSNRAATMALIASGRFDVAHVWSLLRLTLGPVRAVQDSGLPLLWSLNDEHIAGFVPSPPAASLRGLARFAADRLVFREITLARIDLSHATCISRRLRRNLVARGVPVGSARVIYQGIPIERFPCKPDPGAVAPEPSLLYVGQLHPYKGAHTVLQAATLLARGHPQARVRVTVAGTGPAAYRAELGSIAAASGADVTFLGAVSHEHVPALYRSHDVLVFPSEWEEPFGLTHLEAMASGTVVASTADGGHGEFLADGENALLFAKGDAAGLAQRLRLLLSDPALGRRLACRALATVRETFTLDRYVDGLEEMLEEAVRCRSRS